MTLRWERERADWPNAAASRFITAGGLRWHVQVMGAGPDLLLVHGTGASTHSWRDLMPLLAERFRVIAPDLPGHGFTEPLPAHRLSLPGMARALAELARAVPAAPTVAVGHSAGAAILARMCLDGMLSPTRLVSLNGAMLALRGGAARLFSPVAKLLAATPLVPWFFARRAADRAVAERLLRGTGSTLDEAGTSLYARLIRDPDHVAGALGMMAGWDLAPLEADLPRLRVPLLLVTAANDTTIRPADAARVRDLVPGATLVTLPRLGHLAHEEQPGTVARLILHD
jgi:magnesium chelatase accessory protein